MRFALLGRLPLRPLDCDRALGLAFGAADDSEPPVEYVSPVAADHLLVAIASWIAEERTRIAAAVERARQILVAAGLTVEVIVRPGDAKSLLLEEAENWPAEAIFLGAKDLSRTGRLRLGSVSSAIAARAHCSVEIVRQAHG